MVPESNLWLIWFWNNKTVSVPSAPTSFMSQEEKLDKCTHQNLFANTFSTCLVETPKSKPKESWVASSLPWTGRDGTCSFLVPGWNAVLQQHQQWLNVRLPHKCTSHKGVQVNRPNLHLRSWKGEVAQPRSVWRQKENIRMNAWKPPSWVLGQEDWGRHVWPEGWRRHLITQGQIYGFTGVHAMHAQQVSVGMGLFSPTYLKMCITNCLQMHVHCSVQLRATCFSNMMSLAKHPDYNNHKNLVFWFCLLKNKQQKRFLFCLRASDPAKPFETHRKNIEEKLQFLRASENLLLYLEVCTLHLKLARIWV